MAKISLSSNTNINTDDVPFEIPAEFISKLQPYMSKMMTNNGILIYNNETKEYSVNKEKDCFDQLQDAIKIITPYLQTNSQIRNMKFLSIFNEMFLMLKKIYTNKIVTEDDKIMVGKLINQVEKLILH